MLTKWLCSPLLYSFAMLLCACLRHACANTHAATHTFRSHSQSLLIQPFHSTYKSFEDLLKLLPTPAKCQTQAQALLKQTPSTNARAYGKNCWFGYYDDPPMIKLLRLHIISFVSGNFFPGRVVGGSQSRFLTPVKRISKTVLKSIVFDSCNKEHHIFMVCHNGYGSFSEDNMSCVLPLLRRFTFISHSPLLHSSIYNIARQVDRISRYVSIRVASSHCQESFWNKSPCERHSRLIDGKS